MGNGEWGTEDQEVHIPIPHSPLPTPAAGPLEVVAIGTSTGGPNALVDVFNRIPGDFPVPIVIVQHMPPMFTRLLAERLSNKDIADRLFISPRTAEKHIASLITKTGAANRADLCARSAALRSG